MTAAKLVRPLTACPLAALAALLGLGLLAGGCSIRGYAVDSIGDMLASDESVFTTDDDLVLIGDALPFSLKLVESLLAERPEHEGLLLTAARGYVLYAYAYVHFEAEQAADEDLERARALRARAGRLYGRALGYALRGLEVGHPGLGEALAQAPDTALAAIGDDEAGQVPFLYWAASALGLGISVAKDDPSMLARLPEVEALLGRALAIDESFDNGALHEFALVWAAAAPGAPSAGAIEEHYRRALELSGGERASLFVSYAMATAVPAQRRADFTGLMERALAIDPDVDPGHRLQTTLAQRRARWLLGRADQMFLE